MDRPQELGATLPGEQQQPTGEIARGAHFGRYVVVDKLGAGGMGIVYKAYDPELDRRVALKVVRVDALSANGADASEGQQRLLREAQAIARLSHPNVIAVFDVGAVDREVFVAMELVEGPTLRAWLHEAPRPVTSIVSVFAQAARALGAAHDAGLVHRDFKPENVIIGDDGRVRVLDFGLARALDGPADAPSGRASDRLHDRLTATGSILGTPAYMAPEQHTGEAPDARADQFSLCVALFEALHDELPFAGTTFGEYRACVLAGRQREPREPAPRWLRRVLARGLQRNAADRYPTMDALCADLERDPRRWQRRVLAGVAAATLIALAIAGALRVRGHEDPCGGADAKLAGVWDAPRRQAMEAAFTASGRPFAADAWRGVSASLDHYAQAWTAMRRETCEATLVHRTQTGELLDLRMQCLDAHLADLRALTGLLVVAAPPLVERAPMAVRGLPPVAECADVAALNTRMPPPTDPLMRQRSDAISEQLGQVLALQLVGRFKDGLALAEQTALLASQVPFRPQQAQAAYWLAQLQSLTGDAKGAEATFEEALRWARAGRDLRQAAKINIELGRSVGVELQQEERGLAYLRDAEAIIESLGGDRGLEAYVLGYEGQILENGEHWAEARTVLERAAAADLVVYGPDDIELADTLNDLGTVYQGLHHFADARATLERALAIRLRALGPEHPWVASTILNLGNIYYQEGDYAGALDRYQHALAIREKALGPDHPKVSEALESAANALNSLGRNDEALVALERAIAIDEKALGPDHPDVAAAVYSLGNVERSLNNRPAALAAYQRALAIREKALGPDHARIAETVYSIGEINRDLGRTDDALVNYRRALAIDTKAQGADSADLAYDLTGIGATLCDQGKLADALPPLERALELRTKNQVEPVDLAATQFQLARVLDLRGDHARATALATAARAALVAVGPGAKDALDELDAWSAKRGR